jgi:hypothetical protein
MSTDRTKLALRRQSIRTLTASELSVAHGGAVTTGGTHHSSGACDLKPTDTSTDQPQRTRTVA